ncbi:Tyrosine-protein kinase Src42A [Blattella germanica]|nr:Tyrosine-protein kinase Src42A [Blattella germanica]
MKWYFGKIKRIEAEKKLLLPENDHGAFLIRDSESRRNDYSLSVRDGDTVKHYRIRQLDEGGFFIARRTTFRTLQELVEHYSKDADGLCVNLRKPCVQALLSYITKEFCIYKVMLCIGVGGDNGPIIVCNFFPLLPPTGHFEEFKMMYEERKSCKLTLKMSHYVRQYSLPSYYKDKIFQH